MVDRYCKNCNCVLVKKKNIFCSVSCATSFNNKGICRTGNKGEIRFCLFCGKQTGKNAKKFCSVQCDANYRWKIISELIDNTGIVSHKRSAKRYIKLTKGDICDICKMDNKWMGKELVLVLDHINGNSDDFNVSNLRLICPNCDSQTETYKGRNKGRGRYIRKQRYQEGKSY